MITWKANINDATESHMRYQGKNDGLIREHEHACFKTLYSMLLNVARNLEAPLTCAEFDTQ